MEDINVSKTFQMKDAIDSLSFNLQDQDHENISVTTYKLTATIWNKVFNYRQTAESIELDEGQSLNFDKYLCKCKNPELCHPNHGHIITGDLCLIKNENLTKIFNKGPNFREPQSLNYSRCKKEIDRLSRNLQDTID